jgi:hypothetical protein
MNEQEDQQSLQLSNKIITRNHEIPTLTISPQRFHYLYSAVMPQIHLTLVSVLQGIAFGVLLLGIPFPTSFESLFQLYFYFPYLISSLGILIIWKQFMYASMFRNWPASTTQIALIYLLAVGEIIAFRLISVSYTNLPLTATVSTWLICIGLVMIFGGCIRLNDLRLEKIEDFETSDLGRISRKGDLQNGTFLVCSGVALIILALFYNRLIDMLKSTTSLLPWIIYISLFVILCCMLQLDTRHRRAFLRALVKESDLVVSAHGVLRYETQDEIKKDTEKDLASQSKTESKQAPQDEVIEAQTHPFTRKFYHYGFFSLLGMIIGAIVVFHLSQGALKKRNVNT